MKKVLLKYKHLLCNRSENINYLELKAKNESYL